MGAPSGAVWTTIELNDWLANLGVRKSHLEDQVFENLQHLKNTLDALLSAEYWSLRWQFGEATSLL